MGSLEGSLLVGIYGIYELVRSIGDSSISIATGVVSRAHFQQLGNWACGGYGWTRATMPELVINWSDTDSISTHCMVSCK